MSTPNFTKKNASKYYAIEDREGEEDFQYDDLKINLQSEFKSEKDLWDSDRNYGGHIISQIEKEFCKWAIEFDIIIRAGYYSGANLDWDLRIIDTVDRTENYLGEVKLPKRVQQWIDNRIKKVEKVFAEYSTPLNCMGVFSNGEAIYQKVK
jgi:hypothetical protein